MTSPSLVISTGSFFSGVILEYFSLAVPGATVSGTSSILSMSPSSIAAIRTLRAKGEAGEKVSFMGNSSGRGAVTRRRHCERSEAIHGATKGKMDCFVACAPRNDGVGPLLRFYAAMI